MPATPRLHTLDGLRGVAAIAVVMGHASGLLGRFAPGHYWLAVDLFFMMSGAVLGRTYEPRFAAGLSTSAFLRARYGRLLPLLAVGLALGAASEAGALALGRSHLGAAGLVLALAAGLAMLPSPTWGRSDEMMPLNPPGWSLTVELAANLLFAGGRRFLCDRVLAGIVGLSALGLVAELVVGPGLVGSHWLGWPWAIPRIGFSFFLGLLIQRHHPGPGRAGERAPWLILAVAAALLFLPVPVAGRLYDLCALFGALPLLLWAAMAAAPARPRAFHALGTLSYPLYVTHAALLGWLWRVLLFIGVPPTRIAPVGGLLFVGAAIGFAALLAHGEAPARAAIAARLRRLSFPRPAHAAWAGGAEPAL